jgi:ferrous-iron efflux pump FieF
MTERLRPELNVTAGLASVSVASVLLLAKLWAFAATGALSVGASLADSGLDLMISLGGLAAISYAARPPDADHAFGHSSAEDLASLAQAAFILVSGLAIGAAALTRLLAGGGSELEAEGIGIAVMLLSILLTGGLVIFQRRVAAQTGNRIVMADSLHYLGDLIPAVGAIVSLLAARWFGLGMIDSLVALVAAAVMVAGAFRIGRGAVDALMDRQASDAEIAGIARIADDHPEVRAFHDLKTRMAGSRIFVSLHIELDGDQSLEQAHAIGADLRQRILAAYPHADVMIHKDVWRPR